MLATLFLAQVATLLLAHVAIGNVPTFFLLYQKHLWWYAFTLDVKAVLKMKKSRWHLMLKMADKPLMLSEC